MTDTQPSRADDVATVRAAVDYHAGWSRRYPVYKAALDRLAADAALETAEDAIQKHLQGLSIGDLNLNDLGHGRRSGLAEAGLIVRMLRSQPTDRKEGDATSLTARSDLQFQTEPSPAAYSQPPRDETDAEDQSRGGDVTNQPIVKPGTDPAIVLWNTCVERDRLRADIARKDKLIAEALDALRDVWRAAVKSVVDPRILIETERVHAALTEELGR